MMDLIDRYLAAIARRLPADKAADLTAEIRDDLLSRIEAREDATGRRLHHDEVSALIKDAGHPLIVASRYRPNQYLIGPDAFPFFEFSLRIGLILAAAWIVVTAAAAVAFGGQPLMRAIGHAIGEAWGGVFFVVGLVTVIFYALERAGFPNDTLLSWKPEDLPEVEDRQRNSWGSAIEVAVGLFFILWWCDVIHAPFFVYSNVRGLTLTPDPIWTVIWWPVLVLMSVRLLYNVIQWLRPRWKIALASLSVATTAGALALLSTIYNAGHWLTASGSPPADRLAEIDRATNLGLRYAIVVIGVVWVAQCLQELWRMWGRR